MKCVSFWESYTNNLTIKLKFNLDLNLNQMTAGPLQLKVDTAAPQRGNREAVKAVFLGTAGVGKTCFLERAKNNKYTVCSPTICVNFTALHVDLPVLGGDTEEIIPIKLQTYDTSGSDRFDALNPSVIRGCHVGVFMYDLTQIDSLFMLPHYIKRFADFVGHDHYAGVLVGTKNDLVLENLHFNLVWREACRIATAERLAFHTVTSAKTGFSVEDTVQVIGQQALLVAMERAKVPSPSVYTPNIKLSSGQKSVRKGCCG